MKPKVGMCSLTTYQYSINKDLYLKRIIIIHSDCLCRGCPIRQLRHNMLKIKIGITLAANCRTKSSLTEQALNCTMLLSGCMTLKSEGSGKSIHLRT